MTNNGDDCYFFYYSTCSKGDSCQFRHCEAAMGSEVVCNLWEEGRCFRNVCKFRHMEITKNRKEIPCYWENQPAGCQKPHCAFLHEKPRFIEDVFVPPNKFVNKTEVQQHEEAESPPSTSLPTAANPQLRGVIKTENLELVPSPTHPPVVINPADDDEDEDDQFSEEGDDGRGGPSPRKLPRLDESLNFGVSTLEEIRLRKALKISMKKAGYPIQSAETSTNVEKENIRSFFRPTLCESKDVPSLIFEETARARGSVAGRLGHKPPISDTNGVKGFQLKRSLAERLGGVVDEEHTSEPPQKISKSVKERLGLFTGLSAYTQQDDPIETSRKIPEQIHIKTLEEIKQEKGDAIVASRKVPEQLRIKTLEEIKQEKASKAQGQTDASLRPAPENTISKTSTVKSPKDNKRSTPHVGVKTFSEILQAKKRRDEGAEEQKWNRSLKKTAHPVEKAPSKSQEALETSGPPSEVAHVGEVRVKTLEEIRREKAARLQVRHAAETEDKKTPNCVDNAARRPQLLRIKKLAAHNNDVTEKSAEETVKPVKTAEVASETASIVKVKSLDEIMREKRLRKQELQSRDKSATEATSLQNPTAAASLQTNNPVEINAAPSCSALPPSAAPGADGTLSTLKRPAQKLVPPKSKTASHWKSKSVTAPVTAEAAEAPSKSFPQLPDSEPQSTNRRSSPALSTAKLARAAAQRLPVETPVADTTPGTHQKKSPQHTADSKVRPKLNVKPSVMKSGLKVMPEHKRKKAEQSAVAAVKPLNSTSTVQKKLKQETTCRDTLSLPSLSTETQRSSTSSCSPREELQTVPVFKQGPSPVPKTPTQPKSQRASVAASRTAATPCDAPATSSAEDDFDDLINEFTDDHLDDPMDPAIGEDDLLQELSEMIGS